MQVSTNTLSAAEAAAGILAGTAIDLGHVTADEAAMTAARVQAHLDVTGRFELPGAHVAATPGYVKHAAFLAQFPAGDARDTAARTLGLLPQLKGSAVKASVTPVVDDKAARLAALTSVSQRVSGRAPKAPVAELPTRAITDGGTALTGQQAARAGLLQTLGSAVSGGAKLAMSTAGRTPEEVARIRQLEVIGKATKKGSKAGIDQNDPKAARLNELAAIGKAASAR